MSSQRPQERVVFQDYIAKIRYSNQLPPPPNPPKLLDIPGTGLGPKYMSAGYASRLAREQPLNIEADAELGMHIDLIGIPGVFDGNERAISADPNPPTLHPSDRALLRPLASLGKAVGISDTSSFLRRTEYTASSGPQMFASGSSKEILRLQADTRRKSASSMDKDNPKNILRSIIKGFDLAYPRDADKTVRGEITAEESKAWSQPKHPNKQNVELLDSYPILPDLDAMPESAAYIVCKFITNPVARTDSYDQRLDLALMQPVDNPQILADYQRKKDEWNAESGEPEPLVAWDYDFFLPDAEAVTGIKRKFDLQDPDHDDHELYTDDGADGKRLFKYARIRRYETYNQHGDNTNTWNDSVAVALHNPDSETGTTSRLAKGAYIYPVSQRSALRPKRKVGLAMMNQDQSDVIDQLDVSVRDVKEDVEAYRVIQQQKALYDSTVEVPAEISADP